MKLHVENQDRYSKVILLERRLDVLSVSKFKEELFYKIRNSENQNVVLDLSSCSFCDASGLGAINEVHHFCIDRSIGFFLTGIQQNIKSLVKICMLHKVWRIIEDNLVENLFLKNNLGIAY